MQCKDAQCDLYWATHYAESWNQENAVCQGLPTGFHLNFRCRSKQVRLRGESNTDLPVNNDSKALRAKSTMKRCAGHPLGSVTGHVTIINTIPPGREARVALVNDTHLASHERNKMYSQTGWWLVLEWSCNTFSINPYNFIKWWDDLTLALTSYWILCNKICDVVKDWG